MDRYEADWRIVERGWSTHVLGDGRRFASASTAVRALRAEQPRRHRSEPAAVRHRRRHGAADGPIVDGDAVVLFNFRGDRAIEITRAFDDAPDAFPPSTAMPCPAVRYAGMMQYDGDLHLPRATSSSPPTIERTMGELLAPPACVSSRSPRPRSSGT
jgi:2,3-bisphosphoglycerate-independent phosphoglycerate mutase